MGAVFFLCVYDQVVTVTGIDKIKYHGVLE
jgi:hypothetical protein